jgi:phage terminase small subunit
MLTAKQEKFVQNIIEGMSQADAYRNSYSTKRMTDKTIYEEASKLMANPNIATRLQELRDKLASDKIMTAKERLEWLTSLIKSDEETTSDKLKAADIMNKMQGEYTQKIEAEVTSEAVINIELSDDDE